MKTLPLWLLILLSFFSSNKLKGQTASATEGCVPLEVEFMSPGGISDYFWDFKDGSTATIANPTSTFVSPGAYEVELFEGVGGSLIGTITITVHLKPELMITASPTSGCTPMEVNFEDNSNLPSGIDVNNYQWVFGDGNSATGNPVSHTYTDPGIYTVGLNIETNFLSCDVTEIFSELITVSTTPVANFVTDPNPAISCDEPFTVNFNNLTNNPENFTFDWDFGNGNNSTLTDPPAQTYNDGQYNVTLVVTDSIGCSRTIIRAVSVGAPVANFYVPDTVCLDQAVIMENLSSAGNFNWSFGSSTIPPTSTLAQPSVIFTSPGYQEITLTVSSGASGCSHDTTVMVFVDEVDASFTVDSSYTCEYKLISDYTPNSTVAINFEWVFPVEDTITEQFPTDTIYYIDIDSFTINGETLYPVILTVTNPSGCMATYEFIDTIHRPNALFKTDVVDGCVPLTVEFRDTSTSREDIIDWEWHFGDGTVQNSNNPNSFTYTYNNTGEFESFLIVTNEDGCQDTSYVILIEVGDIINPSFTVDQTEVCPGDTVNFQDITNDPRIDAWHFETDNGQSFHCYQEPQLGWTFDSQTGSMDVSLTVEYNGCFSTYTAEDLILVKGPIAQIDYLIECGSPYDYQFRDSSHDASTIIWDFGDGMTSTDGNLTHTYDTTGNFTVILTAENAASGCPVSKDTATVYVRDIEAVFELDSLICYGSLQSLNASASKDVQNECWRGFTWFTTFNRPITTQDVFIPLIFGDSGMQVVTLVTTDINGCSDTLSQEVEVFATRPEFTVDETVICFPTEVNFTNLTTSDTTIVSWDWDFGDGNTSFDQHPTHIYDSTATGGNVIVVELVTTDTLGCEYTASQTISVYKPTSQITATPLNLCLGDEVDFTATDFTSQGSNLSFNWNFGNGQNGNNQSETISYTAEGAFIVQLNYEEIATGCKDSTSTVINVQDYPIANFETSVDNQPIVCYPENILFSDNTTSNNPLTYIWDFGNGQTGTGISPATTFGKGVFEISLISSTSFGCRDTVTKTITLVGPEGDFELDKSLICKGDVITFSLKDTVDVSSYSWDFGDGTGADDIDPVSHQYNFLPPGSTTVVKLVLRGLNDACAIAVEYPIEIINVLADFFPNDGVDTILCVGEVFFNNQSINADIYNWDFGDGNSSMEFSPNHDYSISGTFLVNLAVENAALGCKDTLIKEVIVNALPTVEFAGDIICEGESTVLSVVVSDPDVTYFWLPANVLDDNTLANPTATLTESTTFEIEVTDQNGCVGTTSGAVEVFAEYIGYSWDTLIGIGNAVTLPFIYDDNLFNYSWFPAEGLSCLDCSNPVVSPEGTTLYVVTVEDVLGCFTTTYTFEVNVVSEEIAIPNVFTPDGDGDNDFFNYFLEDDPQYASVINFKVYNRWGQVVYDNDASGQGWDGRYKGEPAPSDVYIYVLEVRFITGKVELLKGDVTLLR